MGGLLRRHWIWLALGALLSGAPAVWAQDQQLEYRDLLALCLEEDDYLCAFDALMEHGETNGFPPVVVSVKGGPTVFGTLMFAVIDRSKVNLSPETRRGMAEQALGYVFDAQPEQGYAAGPYMLLYGEICQELEDTRCVITAAQSVQLFWEQEVWYFAGLGDLQGDNDARARAQALIEHSKEITQ